MREPKYSISDSVYVVYNNSIIKTHISQIKLIKSDMCGRMNNGKFVKCEDCTTIEYLVPIKNYGNNGNILDWFFEEDIFTEEKDLIGNFKVIEIKNNFFK